MTQWWDDVNGLFPAEPSPTATQADFEGFSAGTAAKAMCESTYPERELKETVAFILQSVRTAATHGRRQLKLPLRKEVSHSLIEAICFALLERDFGVDIRRSNQQVWLTLSWGHLN